MRPAGQELSCTEGSASESLQATDFRGGIARPGRAGGERAVEGRRRQRLRLRHRNDHRHARQRGPGGHLRPFVPRVAGEGADHGRICSPRGSRADRWKGSSIAYDLDRDIALVSMQAGMAVTPAAVAPPGTAVRPGDRAFTVGCDKGADPTVRQTQITAVNKYRGKPNFTAAGQPIDGRSGGGLFTADGVLIGICNAADPADDEGLYAGLASIHWQLDQIGQSEIYQRRAQPAIAAEQGDSAIPPSH